MAAGEVALLRLATARIPYRYDGVTGSHSRSEPSVAPIAVQVVPHVFAMQALVEF